MTCPLSAYPQRRDHSTPVTRPSSLQLQSWDVADLTSLKKHRVGYSCVYRLCGLLNYEHSNT